jgi:predicted Zn-dependent protease
MAAGKLTRAFLAVALALAAAGCIQDDGTRYDPVPGRQRMSYDSERELGWSFDLQAQKALPFITDLTVLEFMDDIGNELVEKLGEQPFDYRFRVIVNPELNAFAVPGGYIYFHSGTLLKSGDVEELAGVLAHELAHVKGRHQARLAQDLAIPSILASIAGLAAGAAAGSAGPLVAAQGLNVALQLQYTRQYEDEADRVGSVFMTRAGWRPNGMVRFFERIELEQDQAPEGFIPPYLYSHPAVDARIEVVRELDAKLKPMKSPPRLDERFRAMQGRLAYLLAHKRSAISDVAPHDRTRTDPLLAEARGHRAAGDTEAAFASLDAAERLEPNDPRVSAERGEILMAEGRPADAAVAYRRAVYLDPNPPSLMLALSRAHRAAGNRRKAVFFAEQAVWRSGTQGTMRLQTERELERLIFPVVAQSGFGTGPARSSANDASDTDAPELLTVRRADGEQHFWGRISPHHLPTANYLTARWTDPSGKVMRDKSPRRTQRVYILDSYDFQDAAPGDWSFQVLLADEVVLETTIRVTE